ncbi:uncharacterized protein LOC124806608 isoform X1 [Hydra vulgaris]|uniref:uncharacterized protein LOC124806608 isoform X1 n=1 Tax=Hydra vulgaris TaxID=6087 RepID=UPI0032EA16DF
MKKTAKDTAEIAKLDIKKAVEKSRYPCIIHFDGKTLFEINQGKRLKNERLAVLVNIEGVSHLLGVPALPSSSGENMYIGIMKILEEYDLISKVCGVCFDTTSSNTGSKKGSLTRIAREVDKYLLLLACRHHIIELRMVHFCEAVIKENSVGPENPLFVKFKHMFENPNFKYDENNLTSLDWKTVEGTVLKEAARKTLDYCETYITKKCNMRNDRRELAELTMQYLSPSAHFKLQKTGAVHHARFLGKSLYYLKLQLLCKQLTFVQENDNLREDLKLICEFIVCFYTRWYLQAHKAIQSPASDLDAIFQMKEYKKVCSNAEAVDAVLASLYKHTWYLDSTIIPLALLDKNISMDKKTAIADALLSFQMPDPDFFKHRSKDRIDEINIINNMKVPTLSLLVNEFSYLIFSMIGLDNQRVRDWLSLPPQYWHTQSSFKNFENFAKMLIVVNDHSERAIGMMQKFVQRFENEDDKQNRLLTVDKVRSTFKVFGVGKSNNTKKKLSESLMSLSKLKKRKL